jgi:hypothetical protein
VSMQFILRALFEFLLVMALPLLLVVVGAGALAALLWLATFSQKHIRGMVIRWFTVGLMCVSFYAMLAFAVALLKGPLFFLVVTMILGLLLPMTFRRTPGSKSFHWWALYFIWAYYWVAALLGWRSGLVGLFTITLPALIVAEVGLFIVAGAILPFPDPDLHRRDRPAPTPGSALTLKQQVQDLIALFRYPENETARKQWLEQRRTALRCLLTYALGTNYPYYVVIDEKITERTEDSRTWLTDEDRLVKRLDGDAFGDFMAGPGIVLTGSDHAVVLSTGLRFKGARGPGVVFTGMSETPKQVIDLRPQLRAFPVEAWTKDGIAVEVTTFTPFQIGTGKKKPTLGTGFPYRASDVFKAIHAQPMAHQDLSQTPGNLKPLKWYDLPELVGERTVREIISRYEFDELYAPFELHEDPALDPRSQIAAELEKELERVLPELGLQRIGSGISNLMPVDKRAIEERIEAWKADWTREIMMQQAASQSERLRTVEQARAQAQIDVILTISERMEQLRSTGDPVPMNEMVSYFIEILEKLARESRLRQFLPTGMDDVMRRARNALRGS